MFHHWGHPPLTSSTLANAQQLRSLIWTIGIAWFASGVIFGVSFIATPAKFLASSLDLAQALDVGRATFAVMKWVDLALIGALIISTLSRKKDSSGVLGAVICAVMLVQYWALLPTLDERVSLIQAGIDVEPSFLHTLYIVLETTKIGLFFSIGLLSARQYWRLYAHITMD